MKKVISICLVLVLLFSLNACQSKKADTNATLTIAYQPSIGYAPLVVMKEMNLIEKAFDGNLSIEWKLMNSGAEINEGLVSGSLDIGSMGVPVAVTGVLAGSPYRIASGLSAQPYAIQTNQDRIKSLKDITDEDQIAIVNINSQPHVLLAMACKSIFGDARALDKNLVKLSNADGYTSIVSGSVNCHMVISPFNFMEVRSKDASIHEIPISTDIWPNENTALVTVVRNDLHDNNKALYDAYISALNEAMDYCAKNKEDVAKMLSESYDASADEILEWMQDPRSSYSTELHGVMKMINFMVAEGFLEKGPASLDEIAFSEVKGD